MLIIEPDREIPARGILERLYREAYLETLFNTPNLDKIYTGWTLKDKSWSPWYLNMRPIGATPELVFHLAAHMNKMIINEVPDLTQICGIEMAGVPLAAAIATPLVVPGTGTKHIPYSYTRPIPGVEKVRTPEEARNALEKLGDPFTYGGKELVEGRFQNNETVAMIYNTLL